MNDIKTIKIDSNNIYKSFYDNFGISRDDLHKYIFDNLTELLCVDSVKDIRILKFINYITSFSHNDDSIDRITISHLTTRRSLKELEDNDIKNLFNTLSEQTTLSNHFSKHSITFKKYKGILQMYKCNRLINLKDYYRGSCDANARMISRRFEGNSFYGPDKCVNGYLFSKSLECEGDIRHIQYYPEILSDISNVLKTRKLIDDWPQNNRTFKVSFWIDVANITFDDNKYLNVKRKVFLLYRYLLAFIIKELYPNWQAYKNPMIRLKDGLDVNRTDIHKITEIENRC